ncbi:hypothetical protein Q2T40_19335 [Winogradskyella maritima]|uniref:DUF3244 domain-containing protein n=1 Tax=Winogradskyella maritima TaxID=1517766 RepID=A0ABV8ADZ0_9FLAO|nr:hypothetical protein [Winogradskyella maritima]
MKTIVVGLFILVGLTSSIRSQVSSYDLYLEDELELNGYYVNFTKVIDSRCPKDVICNRSGEAVVFLEVYNDDALIETKTIYVYPNASQSIQDQTVFEVNGYRIKIYDLSPYPLALKPTKPSEYILRVGVWEL